MQPIIWTIALKIQCEIEMIGLPYPSDHQHCHRWSSPNAFWFFAICLPFLPDPTLSFPLLFPDSLFTKTLADAAETSSTLSTNNEINSSGMLSHTYMYIECNYRVPLHIAQVFKRAINWLLANDFCYITYHYCLK